MSISAGSWSSTSALSPSEASSWGQSRKEVEIWAPLLSFRSWLFLKWTQRSAFSTDSEWVLQYTPHPSYSQPLSSSANFLPHFQLLWHQDNRPYQDFSQHFLTTVFLIFLSHHLCHLFVHLNFIPLAFSIWILHDLSAHPPQPIFRIILSIFYFGPSTKFSFLAGSWPSWRYASFSWLVCFVSWGLDILSWAKFCPMHLIGKSWREFIDTTCQRESLNLGRIVWDLSLK